MNPAAAEAMVSWMCVRRADTVSQRCGAGFVGLLGPPAFRGRPHPCFGVGSVANGRDTGSGGRVVGAGGITAWWGGGGAK